MPLSQEKYIKTFMTNQSYTPSTGPINNSISGSLDFIQDTRTNRKMFRLFASSHTDNVKTLSLICNRSSQGQLYLKPGGVENKNLPMNVGGPGNDVAASAGLPGLLADVPSAQRRRMFGTKSGQDQKHDSYARYLDRKKGLNLKLQYDITV